VLGKAKVATLLKRHKLMIRDRLVFEEDLLA
jgi:hypothetical protein